MGVAAIKGQGADGNGQTLFYDIDTRFMSGEYIDRAGKHRHATFGFV